MEPSRTNLEERLSKIEQKQERLLVLVETLAVSMTKHIDDGETWRDKIEGILLGNGDKPGLLIKHDRLEQAHERSRWVVRTIGATVIGLVATALFALLH